MNILHIPSDHPALKIDDPTKANQRGMAALQAGDDVEAAYFFARACALDIKAGSLWRNLANAFRNQGDDDKELAALESALEQDRTDFMAWLRKAQLHERIGEKGNALEAWSGIVQLSSQFDPVPEGLAPLIEHGRQFVATTGAELSAHIDQNLGPDIGTLPPTEQRRVRAFIDRAAGKRRIYQNECAGLYYPFLPADEFFDEEHFPWFSELAKKTDAIREELLALISDGTNKMRPYVQMDKGTPDNKWSNLDHSLNWSACFLWEYGEPNLSVLERCPATKEALEALPQAHIPARAPSAFFSILKPRTHIPPHTGVSNTRTIIHLPLIVPEKCGFRVGGETREWVEGVPFAFDDTIEHEAWNDSDELRAVLIFDVWNPHLTVAEQKMITQFYDAADAAGLNSEKRDI